MNRFPLCVAFAALLVPLRAQDTTATPPFRVLVLPQERPDTSKLHADRAARLLERELLKAGLTVVDREQARLLGERSDAVVAGWLGGATAPTGDARLATLAYADVLVEFGITMASSRKVQGRYLVKDGADFKVTFVDGAEKIATGEASTQATSFDGFGEAHTAAVDALCDAANAESLVAQTLAALTKARDDEAKNGARVTVGFYVDNRFLGVVDALREALQGATGTVAGSVHQLRTFPSGPIGGGESGTAVELHARFRGDSLGLQMALLAKLQELAPQIEKDHGVVLAPTCVASGRRIDLIVKAGPSTAALADEVSRVVRDAVENVWSRNANVLGGKRVVVLPTALAGTDDKAGTLRAFRRGFETTLTSVEKRLQTQERPAADPLTESGPVQVGGESFGDLAAARNRLMDLEEAFYASDEGNLAVAIADAVTSSLQAASAGAVDVQPSARDRDRALDLIKLEAAAYRDDAAIDPATIALYQQRGSEFFVASRVRRFFDKYVVTIDAVDLGTGARYQGASAFRADFSDKLRATLGDR